MTVCNMSIEAGARAGMIAPDETTFAYLKGRPRAPEGAAWDAAVARWRQLPSDDGAAFDREEKLDAADARADDHLRHQPGHGHPDQRRRSPRRPTPPAAKALAYMGLEASSRCSGTRSTSCSSAAAPTRGSPTCARRPACCKGRKVADGVRVLVVPGSQQIKKAAEAEGLDRVFLDAGAEWREAGCSMCIAMNGDQLQPGQYAVSTSNRNFEGRQGAGRPHVPRQPADGGGRRGHRPHHRRTGAGLNGKDHDVITSRTVVLPVENVDTDQIIPARFLKATSKVGLGKQAVRRLALRRRRRSRSRTSC